MPLLLNGLLGCAIVLVRCLYLLNDHLTTRQIELRYTVYYALAAVVVLCLSDLMQAKARTTRPQQIAAWCSAILFSQFITIGESLHWFGNASLCWGSTIAVCTWLGQSIVYTYAFHRLVLALYQYIDRPRKLSPTTHLNLKKWMLVLVSIRLVFFIAYYPCVFDFDAICGLHTFLSDQSVICDHHPVFNQAIHVLAFSLGQSIGHKSAGFALLSLLFILISSGILVYGLKLFAQAGIARKWTIAFGAAFTLFPLFPYLSVYTTKDGFFAYAFLLYLFTLYELVISRGDCLHQRRFILLHGVATLFVCLTRHQGIYIVMLELILLAIAYRCQYRQLAKATLPAIAVYLLYAKVLLPAFDVEPGGKQETYGTFFQQTALYLKQHPHDVTAEEHAAIDRVLIADSLAIKYKIETTDAVKNGYRFNPWYRDPRTALSLFRHIDHTDESQALSDYRSAWLSMGLRHPLTYIQATASLAIGFFHSDHTPFVNTYNRWGTNKNASTPEYRFWHATAVAQVYDKKKYDWVNKPFLPWVFTIPYYNWLAIALLLLLVCRRRLDGLVIFLPVILSVGLLLICPIIDGRYIYPIVMALPLLFLYLSTTSQQAQTGTQDGPNPN